MARTPFLSQQLDHPGIYRRPIQWQSDVGEIVSAYRSGGQALATRSYRAICEARQLVQWVALALSEDVRQVIKDCDDVEREHTVRGWLGLVA